MRLIEELFKKLYQMLNKDSYVPDAEKISVINEIHTFFAEIFDVKKTDHTDVLIEKISNIELLEQYAKMLQVEYEVIPDKKENLYTALEIVEYLQGADSTYSWERTILKEDILRLLDENKEQDNPTI